MGEHVPQPSGAGSVVLNLGPGTGALVLYAPPELDGRELQISPREAAGAGTHSLVRRRHTGRGVQHAAVYPDLPVGEYVIWLDDHVTELAVTVAGGCVTTACWPADPAIPGQPRP
jgi:hypothetical protein